MKELNNLRDAFEAYFIRKDCSPMAFAAEIARYDETLQEPFFEVCIAFIQEVANQQYTDGTMNYYHDIAVNLNEVL